MKNILKMFEGKFAEDFVFEVLLKILFDESFEDFF